MRGQGAFQQPGNARQQGCGNQKRAADPHFCKELEDDVVGMGEQGAEEVVVYGVLFGIDQEGLLGKTVPAVPEYRGGLEGGKGFIPFALARQVCETAVGDAFDGSFVADACKGFQNGVHGKLEQRGKEYGCGYAEHRPSVGFVRTEIPEGRMRAMAAM